MSVLYTKVMSQWKEYSKKHITFIKQGSFYGTFGNQAEIVAKACGLAVTRTEETAYTAFPLYMLSSCSQRLKNEGYVIGLFEFVP